MTDVIQIKDKAELCMEIDPSVEQVGLVAAPSTAYP
jgi:hypothetical protein